MVRRVFLLILLQYSTVLYFAVQYSTVPPNVLVSYHDVVHDLKTDRKVVTWLPQISEFTLWQFIEKEELEDPVHVTTAYISRPLPLLVLPIPVGVQYCTVLYYPTSNDESERVAVSAEQLQDCTVLQ